jgi:peptidoglycan/LPS O-acetylase OafA/YrhL
MEAAPRLGALVAGRDNNVQLVRACAAACVLLFHCYALTGHWTEEPLWRLTRDANLGALGVHTFFVISGFLVTQSWFARARLAPFVAARVLRIYPALVMAALFSVVLAGASSTRAAADFWRDAVTLDYLAHTPLGFTVRHFLPGAYPDNPSPGAANGSLYTLPFELRLYVALALLGALGILQRRWVASGVLAAGVACAALHPAWLDHVMGAAAELRVHVLVELFLLGALAWVWRDAIPVSRIAALAAVALLALDPAGLARDTFLAPLLAYVVLTVAYHPALRWRAFNRLGDYSYGLYVYAFPIQQTLIAQIPRIAPTTLFAFAFPLTLALAMVSWHALERPALGLKSRFHRPPSSP